MKLTKHLKKTMAMILAIIMLLVALPVTTAAAAEPSSTLKVTATSNYFPTSQTTLKSGQKYVTVTYYVDSQKDLLNCQWDLEYDPAVLQFDSAVNMNPAGDDLNLMPQVDDLVWNVITNDDGSEAGIIKANATKLKLYKFANKGKTPFVTATFKVIGTGETTVNLYAYDITFSKLGSYGMDDPDEEDIVINFGEINEEVTQPKRESAVYAGLFAKVLGDVDGNGVLTIADATLIQKYSASIISLTDEQLALADMNSDGAVNVNDATAIQRALVNS